MTVTAKLRALNAGASCSPWVDDGRGHILSATETEYADIMHSDDKRPRCIASTGDRDKSLSPTPLDWRNAVLIVSMRNSLSSILDTLDAAEALHVALEGNHANVYECADEYRAAVARLEDVLK